MAQGFNIPGEDENLVMGDAAPAEGAPVRALTPGQKLRKQELLHDLESCKAKRVALRSEKAGVKAQLGQVKEKQKANEEVFAKVVAKLKGLS